MSKRRPPKPRERLEPGLRAAILARQSVSPGDGMESLSIGSMVRELRERCDREGWPVVQIIEAPNVKGWADEDERPDIQQIFALAESHAIDLVLVWKGDRFARAVGRQEDWVARLLTLGVEVESHTEPAWRTTRLVRVLLGAMAEQTTDDISAHIQRALHDRIRRGLHNGRLPWGYLQPDKQQPLVIDDAIAGQIEVIFNLRRQGWSTGRIARELDRRGIETPSGLSFWREATVRAILANPVYRGATSFGALLVEGSHPAIIAPDDWQAAQRPFAAHRKAPKGEPQTWLAGRVVHACGAPMYVVAYADGRSAPCLGCRYATMGRHHGGEARCGVRPATVNLARAESLAWAAVRDAIGSRLSLDAVLTRAEDAYRAAEPGAATLRRALEERQARLRQSRRRVEELFIAGSRDRAWFDAEDAALSAQLAEAGRQLAALPAAPDRASIAADFAALTSLADAIAHPNIDRATVLERLGNIVIEPTEIIPDGRKPQWRWRARLEPGVRLAALLAAEELGYRSHTSVSLRHHNDEAEGLPARIGAGPAAGTRRGRGRDCPRRWDQAAR